MAVTVSAASISQPGTMPTTSVNTTAAAIANGVADAYGGPAGVLPVVLFELGWTRKAGSTVRPFSYTRVEALETVDANGEPADLTAPPVVLVEARPRGVRVSWPHRTTVAAFS